MEWINDSIKNKYNDSKCRIPLRNRQGVIVEYSLVDEEDFERVNKYRWYLTDGYATGCVNKRNIRLHHFVYKKPENKNVIDHINEDKLNNYKSNLREVSQSTNRLNISKSTRNSSSKYKGVSWSKTNNKFYAAYSGKYLGYFLIEKEAGKAYDIYSYFKTGKHANNNKLISYDEFLEIKDVDQMFVIDDERKYELPKFVYYQKQCKKYNVQKRYKGKRYQSFCVSSIEEAILELIGINAKINFLKLMEEFKLKYATIPRNEDGFAIIKCANNKNVNVLVSDEDWHKISKISLSINNSGYVFMGIGGVLHRYIMNAKDGDIVDHINHKKYDNRRENLRIVSSHINNHNKTKMTNTSSKYFGVAFHKRDQIYQSYISHNHKRHYLGYFKNEIDAANMYNKKAIELYGKHANLNIIEE